MATLPGVEYAVIPVPKIRDYSLNPDHPEGKHKSVVFRSALNIGQEDYSWLIDQIVEGIQTENAVEEEKNPFGKRYRVDLSIRNGQLEAVVRTAWIVRNEEDFPRLTSCYIL